MASLEERLERLRKRGDEIVVPTSLNKLRTKGNDSVALTKEQQAQRDEALLNRRVIPNLQPVQIKTQPDKPKNTFYGPPIAGAGGSFLKDPTRLEQQITQGYEDALDEDRQKQELLDFDLDMANRALDSLNKQADARLELRNQPYNTAEEWKERQADYMEIKQQVDSLREKIKQATEIQDQADRQKTYSAVDIFALEKELEEIRLQEKYLKESLDKPYEDASAWEEKHRGHQAVKQRADELQETIRQANLVQGPSRYYAYLNEPDFEQYASQISDDKLDAYLTEDEANIYYYIRAKEGEAKAQAYLDYMQDTLNQRRGMAMAESVQALNNDDPSRALPYWYGALSGGDQFLGGIRGMFTQEALPTSPIQYGSAYIREDLADVGPEIFGNSLGQIAYDAITTTANMAPSILLSTVTSAMGLPGASMIGSASLGLSAGGNAYQQALDEGYSPNKARDYSILVAASEAALEKVLGGISALSGGGLTSIAKASINNIDSALKRFAINVGLSMLGEGSEEYLQEILSPVFRNLMLGENNEIQLVTEEAAYSFLLGALSGGFFEGVPAAADYVQPTQKSKVLEAAKQTLGEGGYRAFELAIQTSENPTQQYAELTRAYNDGVESKEKAGSTALTEAQYEAMYEAGKADAAASTVAQNSVESLDTEINSEYTENTNARMEAVTDGTEERSTSSGRVQQRASGLAAEESSGGIQSRTGSLETRRETQRRRAESIRAAVDAAGIEKVSTASQGIGGGTNNKTLRVVSEDLLSDGQKAYRKSQRKNGVIVTYVVGEMEFRDEGGIFTARGAVSADGKRMWIRVDHDTLSWEQIADHEDFHIAKIKDPTIINRLREKIVSERREEELQRLVDAYIDLYGWADVSTEYILEEIFADANGDIDILENAKGYEDYEGATRFTETARVGASETMAEANETRGPPGSGVKTSRETRYKSITQREYRMVQRERMSRYGDHYDKAPLFDYFYAHNMLYVIENLDETKFHAIDVIDPSKNQDKANLVLEVMQNGDIESTSDYSRRVKNLRGWQRRNARDSVSVKNAEAGAGDAGLYAGDETSGDRIGAFEEGSRSEQEYLSEYTYSPDYAYWRNAVKDSEPEARYSRELAPVFYSKLERELEITKQDKLGASSVVNMLRGKGVKADEIKWSGIEAYLEGKKSVGKQELLEFVRGNQLQFEEEVLDNKELDYTEEQSAKIAEYTEKHHAIMDDIAEEWERIVGSTFPIARTANINSDDIERIIKEAAATSTDSTPEGIRFSELRSKIRDMISDNDDFGFDRMAQAYRSIVWNPENFIHNYDVSEDDANLILEFTEAKRAVDEVRAASEISEQDAHKLKSLANNARNWMRKVSDIRSEYYAAQSKRMTKWGQYKLDGGENYREYLFKMPGSDYSNQAMAGHWGGERTGVVAHARVQDFEHTGVPVLFIEEIQSDWHNEGQKKGYISSARQKEIDAASAAWSEQRQWVEDRLRESIGEEEYTLWREEPFIVSDERQQEYRELHNAFVDEWNARFPEKLETMRKQRRSAENGAPDAPYAKTYHEYVLKTLLRKAAEGGYSYLAWTPGRMQEERWSSDYAEGYRIEYDQDIPKFLNKYGKQWGAKVDKIRLNQGNNEVHSVRIEQLRMDIASWRRDLAMAETESEREFIQSQIDYQKAELNSLIESGDEVWVIPVTEAMKESVLYAGQAKFSRDTSKAYLSEEQRESLAATQEAVRSAVREELDRLGEEYGWIKAGENPARKVQVPRKTAEDKKVSQTIRTVMEAGATPGEALPKIEEMIAKGEFSYEVYGDEQALKDARSYIADDGWDRAQREWFNDVKKGNVSKRNTATGWLLYDNAVNSGDIDLAMDILNAMVEHQRSAAQALQATRILKQLSPETQLYGVQKSINRLQRELNERYKNKRGKVELKIDEALAKEFMEAETQEDRDRVMQDIYRDIGRQMPSTFRDKWNAWRYLAMLGNARTHVRNVAGNAFFAPVVATKNLTGTAIESAVYRVSGGKTQRTKSTVNKALLSAAWADYENAAELVTGEGKYSDLANANKYIEEGRRIFKTKALEKARRANSAALEAEDAWFSRPHYAYAMAQYCKANGITESDIRSGKGLEKARAYAAKEAQKATYRDTNEFSAFVSRIGRQDSSKNAVSKAVGTVVEGILPFRKTPANILVRGLEYSPMGLLNGIKQAVWDVQKGTKTSAEAIDSISAGLTGTGLMGLGLYLAAQGLIRGHGGEDDEREFEELMGHQAYALELPNGKSYTLDWLAPEALPFFIGVNLWEQTQGADEDVTLSSMLSAVSTVTEPMLEMSCLQSLNDVFDAVGYASSEGLGGLPAALASSATSYLTQAQPTILGQLERSGEGVRMTTYTEKNRFLTGDMQYAIGKASAKLPVWDYQQIPYIDAWGRTESTGGVGERLFNNLLNPAYTSEIDTSAMEEELLALYEATGEPGIFPSRAAKYFTVDKERKDLTAEEYVIYAQAKGQKSYELVSELVGSSQYQAMTDEEKVKAVKNAYDLANQTAKTLVSDYGTDSWIEKAEEAQKKYGIPTETYIGLKAQTAALEGIKDKEGETITNSKSLRVMQAIYNTPGLKEAQRQALFEYFNVGKKVRHYNKAKVNQELAKMEKQAK